jgi:hypothetical protein
MELKYITMIKLPNYNTNVKKTIRTWDRLINNVNNKLNIFLGSRFEKDHLKRSTAFQKINYLLSHITYENILEDKSISSIYFDYILNRYDIFCEILSSPYDIQPQENIFLYNKDGKDTIEYLIPTSRKNPLRNLPINNPDYNTWKKIECIKIITHDSKKLPDQYNFNLTFKNNGPSYGIVVVDIVVLIIKYITKLKSIKEENYNINKVRENFIHMEFYNLIDDSLTIYLKNMIIDVINDEIPESLPMLYITNYSDLVDELEDKILDVKIGSLKPEDFLNIPWINNKSIIHLFNELEYNWYMEDIRQNIGIKFLMYSDLFYIMKSICEFYPSSGFTELFLQRYERFTKQCSEQRIWNRSNISEFSDIIRTLINS